MLLALAATRLSGDDDTPRATDRTVYFNGEDWKDCKVEMSARFGERLAKVDHGPLFNDKNAVGFRTRDVGLHVLVLREQKETVQRLTQFKEGNELTAWGVVHVPSTGAPYVVISKIVPGVTTPLEEAGPRGPTILLRVSGQPYTLERGKHYSLNVPGSSTPVDVVWEE